MAPYLQALLTLLLNDALPAISLTLLVWAAFAPLLLVLGGSSTGQAEDERASPRKDIPRVVYRFFFWMLDNRPAVGLVGAAGLLAWLVFR